VTWVFADGDQATAWWHEQLEELIAALEELQQVHLDPAATAHPRVGWGIARRLGFALRLRADFAEGGEAHCAWQAAAPALARAYPGLVLRPQMGLLPIGPDPQSGLWEFAHLMSGAPARRGADGRLTVEPGMGVVLVLVPHGAFWMGCDADPNSPHFDPYAAPREGPAHEVELSAYFIAKHEFAQPQWLRVMGHNPSAYTSRIAWIRDPMHPVEQVTWVDADRACLRMGLRLPTEAQWERAARGGTRRLWAFAADKGELLGKVNVADRTARQNGATWPALDDWPEHDDGYVGTCPVGAMPANPFGLHEVFGNVLEWCSDGFCPRAYDGHARVDPERSMAGLWQRSSRGGSFDNTAAMARAAARDGASPLVSGHSLGFRPARRVE
jgi:formylglycine-generating enzyme required for sulfatase activity